MEFEVSPHACPPFLTQCSLSTSLHRPPLLALARPPAHLDEGKASTFPPTFPPLLQPSIFLKLRARHVTALLTALYGFLLPWGANILLHRNSGCFVIWPLPLFPASAFTRPMLPLPQPSRTDFRSHQAASSSLPSPCLCVYWVLFIFCPWIVGSMTVEALSAWLPTVPTEPWTVPGAL